MLFLHRGLLMSLDFPYKNFMTLRAIDSNESELTVLSGQLLDTFRKQSDSQLFLFQIKQYAV